MASALEHATKLSAQGRAPPLHPPPARPPESRGRTGWAGASPVEPGGHVTRTWSANRWSHGPHEGAPFASDGHHALSRGFPPCAQGPRPFAAPHWGLPPDSLEGLGSLCQPAVAVAAPLRRVALGPGACDEGTSGVGMARLGDPSLTPALAPGVF